MECKVTTQWPLLIFLGQAHWLMGTAVFDLLSNIQMREGQTLVVGSLLHLYTASINQQYSN